MDLAKIPLNRFIGLEVAPAGSDFLVSLPPRPEFMNHIGTVHAAMLFVVAEAASGEFLLRNVANDDSIVPVVRRVEAKFRKPAFGRVVGKTSVPAADIAEWKKRLEHGQLIAFVPVEVIDERGVVALTATVEWFVTRTGREPEKGT